LIGTAVVLLGACHPDQDDPHAHSITARTRPNVIFILVDTLRPDRLGCYGYRRDNAPTIDAIAEEGVVFERAVSAAPWTQPSMASLFAAVYPGVHGVIGYREAYEGLLDRAKAVTVFADSFQTLAESFHGAGYATAAIMANPFLVKAFGFAQGFDYYDDGFADNRITGDVVNKAALKWLATRDTTKPFFLYLHYMDVHGPYDAAPEFLDPLVDDIERTGVKDLLSPEAIKALGYLFKPPTGPTDLNRHNRLSHYREYWSARYEAGIRRVDSHLAELRHGLIEMGLWQDAYIIVTADHGEALYENGYWDHGFSVHHTDLHVPLILRWPAMLPSGRRIGALTRLIDVAPTLVEQLHLSSMDAAQGRSLVPLLQDDAPAMAPTVAFAEGVKMGPEQQAVYAGEWKLMLTPDTDVVALYRLDGDPLEQHDLAAKYPKLTAELRGLLIEQRKRNEKLSQGAETPRVVLTDEQMKRLRSLGYLGD